MHSSIYAKVCKSPISLWISGRGDIKTKLGLGWARKKIGALYNEKEPSGYHRIINEK